MPPSVTRNTPASPYAASAAAAVPSMLTGSPSAWHSFTTCTVPSSLSV